MTFHFLPCQFRQSADPVERLAARVARETGMRASEAEDILRGSRINCETASHKRVVALFRTALAVKRGHGAPRLEH